MLNKKEKDINDAYRFTYVYVMLDLKGGGGWDTGKINQELMKIINLQIGWKQDKRDRSGT